MSAQTGALDVLAPARRPSKLADFLRLARTKTVGSAAAIILLRAFAIARLAPGMAPYEIMTSESQERMLAIITPDNWEAVKALCDRWEVRATVVAAPVPVVIDGDGLFAMAWGGDDALGAREAHRDGDLEQQVLGVAAVDGVDLP